MLERTKYAALEFNLMFSRIPGKYPYQFDIPAHTHRNTLWLEMWNRKEETIRCKIPLEMIFPCVFIGKFQKCKYSEVKSILQFPLRYLARLQLAMPKNLITKTKVLLIAWFTICLLLLLVRLPSQQNTICLENWFTSGVHVCVHTLRLWIII